MLVTAQLPDGASLERTQAVIDQVSEIAGKNPAVENVIAISGVSALDNNSTLANAGVAYVVLKDWSVRGKGEDLRSLFQQFNRDFAVITEARIVAFPPPPIQGIGNAGGFAMQMELRDGSFDLTKLQTLTNAVVKDAQIAEWAAAGDQLVPLHGAADEGRCGPRQGGDAAGLHR